MILKLDVQRIDPLYSEERPSGHWRARCHIAVDSYSRDNGDIFLSAECVGKGEVAHWADLMIKELEAIKREAAEMEWNALSH
jgi:hypothetical protein